MKYIKIISCLILFVISFSVSAEVKLRYTAPNLKSEYRIRTVTPKFSVKETKYNQCINNISNNYVTHKTNVSYLSIENNQHATSHRNTITGKSTNYYHRYSTISSQNTKVSYNNHVAIKSYNVANRAPFEGDATAILTTTAQYSQFGPPDKGPISDVIWPLLIFVGIYLLKLKVES